MRLPQTSRRLGAFLAVGFGAAALMALARVVFYLLNKPAGALESGEVLKAFFIGTRFDLRIAFLFALSLGVILLLPYKKWLQNLAAALYGAALTLLTLVYFIDFGYYAYLGERLNAYALDLAADTRDALLMIWQSYPVIPGALALAAVAAAYFYLFKKLLTWAYAKKEPRKNYFYAVLGLAVAAAFVHGRVSQYPLRWSQAYFSQNAFISALALNPLQNVADTYAFAKQEKGFNADETRKYYDITADFLGVTAKDKENLNFTRIIPAKVPGSHNVVVIFTESLAFDKTTFQNPALDTTPYLYDFAKTGTLLPNFFTPTAGTARGVWTTITGNPDTSATETLTRNPRVVRQHTLIDDFKGYNKMYFIGGSTNWGNVRGLLQNNIKDLQIYEEGYYKNATSGDVWGVSDLDMLRQGAATIAATVKQTQKPFFAILQTAGFHRPFTIPKDRGSFELLDIPDADAQALGFVSAQEYNALRFQDYAIGEFINLLRNEDFYKNTIFVIYGDHGVRIDKNPYLSPAFLQLGLAQFNTPLIIAGPGVAAGAINPKTASQTDITATIAGLLGIEYRAGALGRDILDDKNPQGAFMLPNGAAPLNMGFIEGDYYYTDWQNLKGLYNIRAASLIDECPQRPQQCERMRALSRGLYEAARYITYHQEVN